MKWCAQAEVEVTMDVRYIIDYYDMCAMWCYECNISPSVTSYYSISKRNFAVAADQKLIKTQYNLEEFISLHTIYRR